MDDIENDVNHNKFNALLRAIVFNLQNSIGSIRDKLNEFEMQLLRMNSTSAWVNLCTKMFSKEINLICHCLEYNLTSAVYVFMPIARTQTDICVDIDTYTHTLPCTQTSIDELLY